MRITLQMPQHEIDFLCRAEQWKRLRESEQIVSRSANHRSHAPFVVDDSFSGVNSEARVASAASPAAAPKSQL